MSFLRHRQSIHPMWKEQSGSRLGAPSRLSSARMSRSRLFFSGSVSTGAHLRFTGCPQDAVQWSCRSTILKRTANSVLFGFLSQGVHPIALAGRLAPTLADDDDFEVLEPQCLSIVCFRYAPAKFGGDARRLDSLNKRILEIVQLGGEVFFSTTLVDERFWLCASSTRVPRRSISTSCIM